MAQPDPLEELRNFNSKNLWDKLINMSEPVFEEWLKEKKLLYTTRRCPECDGNMSYHWIANRTGVAQATTVEKN